MQEDAVGIVLAGGRSERLRALGLGPAGKAALRVGGRTCLERVCAEVGSVTPRVIVVAAVGQPLPELPAGVEVVRDARPAGGPLAAVLEGLRWAAGHEPPPRLAFVTSCDAPLLSAGVVRLLLEQARSAAARCVVPVIDGHPQVLVSVLACDLLAWIEGTVETGGGLRALIERLTAAEPAAVRLVSAEEIAAVDPGLGSFLDIDTPEDLARIEARGFPPSRR